MSIVHTVVPHSADVGEAALNLNAKAYEVRRTLAAVWDCKPTGTAPPPPECAVSLDMRNSGNESVIGTDERTKVEAAHFNPGGKYRSIVKLFIHYEFQPANSWAMGTGWLIKPDIFVTAGHCSYDWSHKWGRATEVKAYIGYNGHQSEQLPSVQFRHVKRVVTTEGWVKTKGQKCFDVSFMQVDRSFSGVTPIQFAETPAKGDVVIGVVGYPGDLYDEKTKEHGAQMYEMFLQTKWDLAHQADTMLEYQIDTYGGNSGSPVLRKDDMVSIGAHVYGGELNSASVIGKYGNPYHDYLAAFHLSVPNAGLNLVPVTGNVHIAAPVPSGFAGGLPASMRVSHVSGVEHHDQEMRLAGPQRVHPNALRRLGDASVDGGIPQTQSDFNVATGAHRLPGKARAVLTGQAEMFPSSKGYTKLPEDEDDPDKKPPKFNPKAPPPSDTAPKALKILGGKPEPKPKPKPKGEAFSVDAAEFSEESFLSILKKAASVAAPLLGTALKTGLPLALGPIGGPVGALAGFALAHAGQKLAEAADGEAFTGEPTALTPGHMEQAILAESILQTLQNHELPAHMEESIFSDMKDTVMRVLPTVRAAAPHVMGAMMEPALRIALDHLHAFNQKGGAGAEAFADEHAEPFRPAHLYPSAIDHPSADHQHEQFLRHMHVAMQKHADHSGMDGESAESFLDVLKAGVRLAGKGVEAAAKHGLPILLGALASQGGQGAEATLVGPPQHDQVHAFSADDLAHRAVVAHAAYQAVMKQNPQSLAEEGFFDVFSKVVKTIAPIALKMAPVVASAINPTMGSIVRGVLGGRQEAGLADEPAADHFGDHYRSSQRERISFGAPPSHLLRTRHSLATLRPLAAAALAGLPGHADFQTVY